MLPNQPECGSPCSTCEALAHENGRLRAKYRQFELGESYLLRERAEKAEADNARLRAELEKANRVLENSVARPVFEATCAELTALREDKQRMDWLDLNPRKVAHASGYHGERDSWSYFDAQRVFHDAPSLRDAIDAARAALEAKP